MCLSHSDALSRLDCQWTYERRKESAMRVFLAGGTGAIGRRLVPQLVARGHEVTATTRDPDKVEILFTLGATPVLMNGLDGAAVGEAVAKAQPEAIIHEMTALTGTPDFKHFDRWFTQTNRLRTEGTGHLLAAAKACGVRRFVAQSYTGWTNARDGDLIKTEADPFDPHPAPVQRTTLAAIQFVEPAAVSEWLPYLAEAVGAKRPMRVPAWLARFAIWDAGVQMMTAGRGSSNE